MENVQIALDNKAEYSAFLTQYVAELRSRADESRLVELSEKRQIPLEAIQKAEIFYINEMTQMLLPRYFGDMKDLGVISETNNKPIFSNRWVFPIKDCDGNVLNLVGYSKEAKERYIYGTSKYYDRLNTMWGLENLEMAYDLGYAIVTEGITDALRVRSLGFPNTFAMCGTHASEVIIKQLNRCRYGVIRVPDRDSAGMRAVKEWKFNRFLTLMISIRYKDIDEMCFDGAYIEWVISALNDGIEWLKEMEHNGTTCGCETINLIG